MNELFRFLSLFLLIIINQILLATNIWSISPDLFIVQTLIFTTFFKKIPNVYFFIFKGFLIDLFYSNIALPYTLSFMLIGLYLNFSSLRWIQKSLLEQIILIISVSTLLNIFLFSINDFSDGLEIRILINPLFSLLPVL